MNKKSVILLILLVIVMPISYAYEEKIYIYGNGLIASKDDSNQITYYHQDFLGSNRFTTNMQGELIGKSVQEPYGSDFSDKGTREGLSNDYKFTGQEQDDYLYYYGARYYEPSSGRFIGVDPVFSPDISPYAYANNNPMKYVDPSGRQKTQLEIEVAKGPRQMTSLEIEQLARSAGLTPETGRREGTIFRDANGNIVRDPRGRPEVLPKHKTIGPFLSRKILRNLLVAAKVAGTALFLVSISVEVISAEPEERAPILISSCLGALCPVLGAESTADIEHDTLINPETGEFWPWVEFYFKQQDETKRGEEVEIEIIQEGES